jgi:hypothetical protein
VWWWSAFNSANAILPEISDVKDGIAAFGN